MATLWFLNLALKCIHHFAWPLLALGYPMCASVQAIETDSNKEMRNLISYWILLSLLYLFEYAFMRLLQWFQCWPYMKLMIIFWLIIPDFGRASNVYNNLICSWISMKPQTDICRWRKFFVKKENFLLQEEKYIKDNGTEALEKFNASKDTTDKPDAEATNAIRVTCNKEMQQKNEKMLQTEHKDIKDLEVIEKKEIPAGKQDIPSSPNLAASHNASSTMVENKGIGVKGSASEEFSQSSTHKEVQKEWTCALCQIKASSEKNLKSHLHGKKHWETYQALRAKTRPVTQKLKIDLPKEEQKQKNIITNYQLSYKTNKGESIVNTGLKGNEVMDHNKVKEMQKILSQYAKVKYSNFRCEVCNVCCTSKGDLASHLNGRKHLENIMGVDELRGS
ncbi:uncharacterized protein LOC130715590 isoform X2 [Lotus japonicus]|uniref:uncharacterized protein LOC130715590 isoform X2 n=1 Tax=Lotus japonicus TaxID=34305 RepID=UPI00258DD994|nr:uncharacterized protein LOC130715590 isoform X2 [Lotus japonicus]